MSLCNNCPTLVPRHNVSKHKTYVKTLFNNMQQFGASYLFYNVKYQLNITMVEPQNKNCNVWGLEDGLCTL